MQSHRSPRLLAGLLALTLLAGCAAPREEAPAPSGQEAVSEPAGGKAPAVDALTVGAIAVPVNSIEGIVPRPESWPELYTENGKYGFRNADGSILAPAEYEDGQPFSDRYLGKLKGVRSDGEIVWYTIGLNGNHGEMWNSFIWDTSAGPVVLAEREEGYSLENLNLSDLVPGPSPLAFSDGKSENATLYLQWEDGRLAQYLPEEDAVLLFEPCAPDAEGYRAVYDLDGSWLVSNGQLVAADGSDPDFPLPAAEQVPYTLITADGFRETTLRFVKNPDYDGAILQPEEGPVSGDWVAVPGAADAADWQTPAEEPAAYAALAERYLAQKGLAPGEAAVTSAVAAGEEVLLTVATPLPEAPEADSRALSAVLWFPDASDPAAWQTLEESELTGSKAIMTARYTLLAAGPSGAVVRINGYEGSAVSLYPLAD